MQQQLLIFALAFAASHAWAQAHEHGAQGHEHSGDAETAFGRPGDPGKVDRTINVEMRDPAEFAPSRIEVNTGETILFVVRNAGKHEHEMVLGTMKELEQHYAEMKRNPHGMHHSAPHIAVPAPGKTAVIVWQFTKPGEFNYGCLIEDHFELGMFGKIVVTGAPASDRDRARRRLAAR